MSGISSNTTSNLHTVSTNSAQIKVKSVVPKNVQEQNQTCIVAKDTLFKRDIKVQQGIIPTVAGALVGGTSAALVGKALTTIAIKDSPEFFVPLGTLVFAVSGSISGATVANYTDSKAKGAIAGAVVGALLGATVLPFFDSPKVVLVAASIGAAGGAIGGLSSSFVAKAK